MPAVVSLSRARATLRACPTKDVEKWRLDLRRLQGTDLDLFVRLSKEDFNAAVDQRSASRSKR